MPLPVHLEHARELDLRAGGVAAQHAQALGAIDDPRMPPALEDVPVHVAVAEREPRARALGVHHDLARRRPAIGVEADHALHEAGSARNGVERRAERPLDGRGRRIEPERLLGGPPRQAEQQHSETEGGRSPEKDAPHGSQR
jgi:hypothetical protein